MSHPCYWALCDGKPPVIDSFSSQLSFTSYFLPDTSFPVSFFPVTFLPVLCYFSSCSFFFLFLFVLLLFFLFLFFRFFVTFFPVTFFSVAFFPVSFFLFLFFLLLSFLQSVMISHVHWRTWVLKINNFYITLTWHRNDLILCSVWIMETWNIFYSHQHWNSFMIH